MSTAATIDPRDCALPPPCVKMRWPMAADAMPSEEEARLGERLREGDEGALRDVYGRFGRVTFGFLVKTLGDRATAEDVQQHVFLEVWRRAESFDPERGRLLTWVMTIARTRAIDQLRRRVPDPVEPQTAEATLDATAPAGESEVEELAERWRMRGLLERLPESEAELLRLRFYGGMTQSEIAARDGIPLGTVKSRMFSGLRSLREMIEEENGR